MQNGMIDLYVRGNNSVAYSEIYSSFASEKIVIFLICCCWLSIMTALRYENMEKHILLLEWGIGKQHNIIPKAKTILWIFHTEKICGVWNTRQIIDFVKKLINF